MIRTETSHRSPITGPDTLFHTSFWWSTYSTGTLSWTSGPSKSSSWDNRTGYRWHQVHVWRCKDDVLNGPVASDTPSVLRVVLPKSDETLPTPDTRWDKSTEDMPYADERLFKPTHDIGYGQVHRVHVVQCNPNPVCIKIFWDDQLDDQPCLPVWPPHSRGNYIISACTHSST